MNAIVIERVPIVDLPPAWQARLTPSAGTTVTVRIEETTDAAMPAVLAAKDNTLFGMWKDRDDMADVADYVRSTRAPRFNGSPQGKDQ